MTDDRHLLVCARSSEFAVSGSTHATCANCGTEVWVAPSSWKVIEEGAVPVCRECALAAMRSNPAPPEFNPLTGEQVQEIVRGLAEYRRQPPV